jgi:tRNA(Ile)-lysidine synthase
MIKMIGDKLPRKLSVALSGGADSMAVLDFLIRGRRDVTALHFDHGTEHGKQARAFVTQYCADNKIPLIIGEANREKSPDESPEEFWRNMRYSFFNEFVTYSIVTAHTLDDQVENWIFTSLHGEGRLIPYRRNPNIIRPFITTTKSELLEWCGRKNIPYVTDPGNSDEKYMRSLIRMKIVPEALRVNPGLFKVIKKKVLTSL